MDNQYITYLLCCRDASIRNMEILNNIKNENEREMFLKYSEFDEDSLRKVDQKLMEIFNVNSFIGLANCITSFMQYHRKEYDNFDFAEYEDSECEKGNYDKILVM